VDGDAVLALSAAEKFAKFVRLVLLRWPEPIRANPVGQVILPQVTVLLSAIDVHLAMKAPAQMVSPDVPDVGSDPIYQATILLATFAVLGNIVLKLPALHVLLALLVKHQMLSAQTGNLVRIVLLVQSQSQVMRLVQYVLQEKLREMRLTLLKFMAQRVLIVRQEHFLFLATVIVSHARTVLLV